MTITTPTLGRLEVEEEENNVLIITQSESHNWGISSKHDCPPWMKQRNKNVILKTKNN